MRACPDPAVHHGEQHAALTQGCDHFLAGHAGTIRFKENQVGFRLLYFHAGNLRKAPRQRAGVGMIFREAVDVMIERENAGGGANAGLAPRDAKPVLPVPDLVDVTARYAGYGTHRSLTTLLNNDL